MVLQIDLLTDYQIYVCECGKLALIHSYTGTNVVLTDN